ncbi:MAG: tetratricopeptide repeat protein [Proteobacteria bacterium]|nr:tetratricopeptide repeat protein [Pseudomonadota bacterium]
MAEQSPNASLDRGLALHRRGKLAEAAAIYESVLASDAGNADALHFLGLIAHQRGDHVGAVDLILQAIALDEARPTFHHNLGTAFMALARLEDAIGAFRRSAVLDPSRDDTHYNLGTALGMLGRYAEAEPMFREAVRLNPEHAAAWSGLGAACSGLRRHDEALSASRRAVTIDPRLPEAHLNLGNAQHALGDLECAENSLRAAIELKPDYAVAYNSLAKLLADVMAIDEALDCFRRAMEIDPLYRETASNYLLYQLYASSQSEADIFEAHRDRARRLWPSDPVSSGRDEFPAQDFEPERRLRIGYVSADFRTHSCAYFLEPLFEHHDRAAIELFAYANVENADERTQKFRESADHWRDISGLGDEDAAALVREDKIDILVELSGHTRGNRLGLFALRPAPIQISWLGYPATTGLDQIDYRLTDAFADPLGSADRYHTEKLIRLPDGFHCYAPPDAPDVSEPPSLQTGEITFGSFNNFLKLSPECLDAWAAILDAVPSSRLLLKCGLLTFDKPKARLLDRFAARGIDPDRIALHGWIPRGEQPLALYRDVDIALDSFPYNGTTTSFETLWMGVPLVTISGDRHAARVGCSILTHLGYGELVAETVADYIALAAALAGDRERISSYRRQLRLRLAGSPFCDGPRFARSIEKILRNLWVDKCHENT